MLTKTITYQDFDGNDITEEFCFNLTKSELTKMQLSKDGGLAEWLERMIKSRNNKEIMNAFEQILLKSYGIRSDDRKRFIKSEEISREFQQTNAYDILFMELIENETKMADFINAVMPKEVSEKVKERPIEEKIDNISVV